MRGDVMTRPDRGVTRGLDSTLGESSMRHAGEVGDQPEYYCADDGRLLEPVTDAGGVVACPSCRHRSDAPGRGVLADGFDVVLRQWGTRGDPHAWRALRELVGATPTPASHPASQPQSLATCDATRSGK